VVGTKKYKGLELYERTVRAAAIHLAMEMNRLSAKVKGRGSARRPPSGRDRFLWKTNVTAEAVTYKATGRAKDERVQGVIALRTNG